MPYCAILGTEPLSVTFYKTDDGSQIHVNISCNFKTFLKGCLNQRDMPGKRDEII